MSADDFEFDTAEGTKPPASAYVEDAAEADPTMIGTPGDGMIEFDVEYAHPRTTGAITVYATGKLEAAAATKEHFHKTYGGELDDTQVLTVEPA